jgi:peptide-methionine (R)-S-oxide reductase
MSPTARNMGEEDWMFRRDVLLAGISMVAVAATAKYLYPSGEARAEPQFEIMKSEAEWKRSLSPEQFQVLRQEATERPFSSPLNNEHRHGIFACAGCGLALFKSETKFDSGTGWPSFYAPIEGAVGTSRDVKLVVPRIEVHCHRCGGHLGHVFDDGPPPTGKRYCMNGLALKFTPGEASGSNS